MARHQPPWPLPSWVPALGLLCCLALAAALKGETILFGLVLLATLLLWSGNWIVARAVRDDIAPGMATLGRLAVVLLIVGLTVHW